MIGRGWGVDVVGELFVCTFVCLCQLDVSLSFCLSICVLCYLFICLSVCLPVCVNF